MTSPCGSQSSTACTRDLSRVIVPPEIRAPDASRGSESAPLRTGYAAGKKDLAPARQPKPRVCLRIQVRRAGLRRRELEVRFQRLDEQPDLAGGERGRRIDDVHAADDARHALEHAHEAPLGQVAR